jgi:hypothetical protein
MSFQATEWARGLPLHSLSAKFTLMMIGSYAGTDGTCFPSLGTLAEDTLQSVATVRRRVRELEDLGILVRFSRWTSPDGKVVLTQVGDDNRPLDCRQSSDELRLQLHVPAEVVKAKIEALGWDKKRHTDQWDEQASEGADGVANCDPTPLQSDTLPGAKPVQPAPSQAADTPGVSPGSHPLNRPLKSLPESTPLTPRDAGGENAVDIGLRKIGDERLAIIKPIWPDDISNAEKASIILGALTDEEWADCQTGAKGYADFIKRRRAAGHDRIVKDFHNWARNQQWAGHLESGRRVEAVEQIRRVPIDSREGKAWAALHRIAHTSPRDWGDEFILHRPLTDQILALANTPPDREWVMITPAMVNQVGAWRAFLGRELGTLARPELLWDRNPGGVRGFLAPWPWPPKKDGTLSATAPDIGCSDAELADFNR